MIVGLIVDALGLGAIAAFAWAGMQLGARTSLMRTGATLVAALVAILLRDIAGERMSDSLHASDDFGRLVAMLAVGVATFLATTKVLQWWLARRDEARVDEDPGLPVLATADQPRVAAAAGAVLGAGWAVLFIAMLVLLPTDNPITRTAVESRTGSALIAQQGALQWLREGFPHYTQTLPKGDDGAVVGERPSIPLHGQDEATPDPEALAQLLAELDDVRERADERALVFNTDVSKVAERHARGLVAEQSLSYETPGGSKLDGRIRSALGASAGDFRDEYGIEVVWAHSAANAVQAIEEDDRARALVRDGDWGEVGVGAIDAGWFDGYVFVLVLLAPTGGAADAGDEDGASEPLDPADVGAVSRDELDPEVGGAGDGAGDASGDGAGDPAGDGDTDGDGIDDADDPDPLVSECEPYDLDGDGLPDEQSVDPAC